MLVAGCDSGVTQVSEAVACADFVNALCGELDKCGAPEVKILYGDVTTCQTRLTITCKSALHNPGTTLTTNRLDACAKDIMALSCTSAFNHTIPDSCKAVPGTLADGAVCGDDGQCKSAFCKKPAGSACGVCGERDGTCVVDGDCVSGSVCAGTTCVQRAAMGAACSDTQPCMYGLVCDGGSCKMPAGLGMSCTPNTSGGNCDLTQGNFCNPVSMVCQAVGYAGPGASCGLQGSGYSVCTSNGRCTAQINGNCKAAAADGAACDPVNQPNCQPPATCINSLCTLPDTSTCK
jgi:hypothetical protein